MLLDLNRYSLTVFGHEAKALTKLALPMMLAQIAAVGVGFVDTVMAGAAGKDALAAVALGSSAFVTVFVTLMGVMTALNPTISQLWGAGKQSEVGETGRQGLWFGLLLGIIGMVLLLAAKGLSGKEIASQLFISERTVQTHLASIYDKLGARNKTESMLLALKYGVVMLEELLD